MPSNKQKETKMEARELRLSPLSFEIRKHEDEEGEEKKSMTLRGHASVFNSLSEDLGGFREMVKPGAFRQSVQDVEDGEEDIRALSHHDTSRVLGRTSNGTLRIREDEIGLAVEIDLPDTTDGRDMQASVERGDIDSMSIGFMIRDEGESWEFPDAGVAIRTVTDIDLFEVSAVAFPAFKQTDISVAQRSMEKAKAGAATVPDVPAQPEQRISPATRERLLKQKQLEFDI
jgi:HK97 family phage prohead protease